MWQEEKQTIGTEHLMHLALIKEAIGPGLTHETLHTMFDCLVKRLHTSTLSRSFSGLLMPSWVHCLLPGHPVCGSQYSNCYVSARTSFTALQLSSLSCTLKLTTRALFLEWYHFLESKSGSPSSHSAQTFPSWGIYALHGATLSSSSVHGNYTPFVIFANMFGNCWYHLLLPSSRWQTV